jgi:hypothetical protein
MIRQAKLWRPRRLQEEQLAKEIESLFAQSRGPMALGRLQQLLGRQAIIFEARSEDTPEIEDEDDDEHEDDKNPLRRKRLSSM